MARRRRATRDRRILGVLDIAPAESLSLMDVKMPRIYERLRHASRADIDGVLSEYSWPKSGQTAAQSKLMINYLFVDIVLVASRIVRDCGGVPQEVIPAAFQPEGKTAVAVGVDETLAMAQEVIEQSAGIPRRTGFRALRRVDPQGQGVYRRTLRKP